MLYELNSCLFQLSYGKIGFIIHCFPSMALSEDLLYYLSLLGANKIGGELMEVTA